MIKLQ